MKTTTPSRALVLVASAACACAPSPTRGPAAPPTASADATLVASIARVERGLIPETRVRGEHGGWSIEERMRAHHIPGVSIAVIHDHRVAWARAYGVADAITREPLTETTLMQAGSISKTITAYAALKQVHAGRVSLDANVNQALHTWHLPESELTRTTPVTLRGLLSHTAGINLPGTPGYLAGESVPSLLDVLDGKPPASTPAVRVEIAPGTKFGYSSGGTTVVQEMLVELGARPFPAFMHDEVLAPMGMTRSTFDQPTVPAASAHDVAGAPLPGKRRIFPEMAAGGLWTTPGDLARFVVELQLGLRGRSSVVSKEIATDMTTPIRAVGEGAEVSLGTFIEKHGGGIYVGHDGLGEGFTAMMRFDETRGEGAVIMANGWAGFTGAPLTIEIFRSVAAEYGWEGWLAPEVDLAHVDAARLDALSGAYGTGFDGATVITRKGDHLEARQAFKDSSELLPISSTTFVRRDDGARFTFHDADLVTTPTAWPPGEKPSTLARVRDAGSEPLFALEAGRFDEALAKYETIFAANADDERTSDARFADLAMDFIDRQRAYEKAVQVLRVDVALHPESASANAALAEAHARAGHALEARGFHRRAEELLAGDGKMSEWSRIVLRWKLGTLRALIARTPPPR